MYIVQHGIGIGIGAQAVGGEHGHVQLVVQLAQHAHQALGVDGFFFGREGTACAQRGEDVVQAGEGET